MGLVSEQRSPAERLVSFRERTVAYAAAGHDRLAAARFVADAAGPLSGPALDVGTGKGLLAIALARRKLDVVSVDVEAGEQELAALLAAEAGLAGRIRFVHGDAAELRFPNGHFGCAAMMDVLHHLEDPLPVLREMLRVVRPGGVLVVADFSEKGFALVESVIRSEGGEHPRTGATVAAACDFLEREGLSCTLQTEGCLHVTAVFVVPGAGVREKEGDRCR